MHSSEIVCQALDLTPSAGLGTPAEHDGHCGYCGTPIKAGEKVEPLEFRKSFIDHNMCADPMSPYACLYCVEIMDRSAFLQKLSSGIFTTSGMYPVSKKIHRAHFLNNPPAPPFTFAIQTGKSQHVVWKAPVNFSRDVFTVQVGDRSVIVRHALFMAAVSAVKNLRDRYSDWLTQQAESTGTKPKALDRNTLRAFGYTDMKTKQVGTFRLGRWITDMLDLGVVTDELIQPLKTLNWGEAWLLDTASVEDDSTLERPEALTL